MRPRPTLGTKKLSWVGLSKSKRARPDAMLDCIAAWFAWLVWMRLSATVAGWTERRKVANRPYPVHGTLVPGEQAGGMRGLCLRSPWLGHARWRHWESWRWAHGPGGCGVFTWEQKETVFPCIQRRLCRVGWICLQTFVMPPFPEDERFFIWKSIVRICVIRVKALSTCQQCAF